MKVLLNYKASTDSFFGQENVNVMNIDGVDVLPWDFYGPSLTLSAEEERFLLDALSDSTDEEMKDLLPSSTIASSISTMPSLPQTQQQKQPILLIAGRQYVKRGSGKLRRLCQRPDCDKLDRGSALCGAHGGGKRCLGEFCEKASRKRGFCTFHYRLFYEDIFF